MKPCLPASFEHVDKYVLDNGQGGSGQRFDWSLLKWSIAWQRSAGGGLRWT
ncbi:hypothetical protein ACNKHV_07805 [Shigella flexneri]